MLRLEGKAFLGVGVDGDFKHMLTDPTYDDAILFFNDNVLDAYNPVQGGGSASVRLDSARYQSSGPPRVFGIPTGWSVLSGAFNVEQGQLEMFAARAIVLEMERLIIILKERGSHIKRLIYSSDQKDPSRIGQGIFSVPRTVIDFIMTKLSEVPSRVASADTSKFTHIRLDELVLQVVCVANLHSRVAMLSNGGGAAVGWNSLKRRRDDVDGTGGSVFFTKEGRLSPDQELLRGLHLVGSSKAGKVVYEKRAMRSPCFM
jgi:hypothetical protein